MHVRRFFDVYMLYDLVIIVLQTQSGRLDVRPLQESKYLGRLIIDTKI